MPTLGSESIGFGGSALGALVTEDLGDGHVFATASAGMRRLGRQIEQIAGADVPVLLLGESGSGKEVAARLIHKRSPRRHRPFLKVNCAALPAELLESELFGFEAGAFTGALRAKPGKFEFCQQGTIFMDEIGEMPNALQAKLLQVLEDRQFSRLGGRTTVRVDARIVAATNVEMRRALARREFREDLYYRLNAVSLHLPSLRDRREEIVPLLHYFMDRLATRYGRPPVPLSPEVLKTCENYVWPGNVRELQNFVKRCLLLGADAGLAELRPAAPSPATWMPLAGEAPPSDLKAMVRKLKSSAETIAIRQALSQTDGNRPRAARALRISAKALLQKIRLYGIAAQPGDELPEPAPEPGWEVPLASEP